MDTIKQVLDSDTGNHELIGKVQHAIPTILYPKKCKIILEKEPTQEGDNTAKSNLNKTFRVQVYYLITAPKSSKIDINKINKIDKPTIHVTDPKKSTPKQLKS